MARFNDDEFTSQADAIMLGEEGTAHIQEFIERWFEWNIGDPSWADNLWEMLSLPATEREAVMEEWN
jgi:hypothetical protein